VREPIRLESGVGFRLAAFNGSFSRIDVFDGGGRRRSVAGYGPSWHYHVERELIWIEHGAGERIIGSHRGTLADGELLLIGPRVPHCWRERRLTSGVCLHWDVTPGLGRLHEAVLEPLQECHRKDVGGMLLRGRTAEAIIAELRRMLEVEPLERVASFYRLLGVLHQRPEDDVEWLAAPIDEISAESAVLYQQALEYLRNNYHKPLSIVSLMRVTGMSRATLYRMLRQHAGKGFSELLNETRLEAVAAELRAGDDSVAAIARRHGFGSLAFFNRLFRRSYGCTPREYRRSDPSERTT
jgi:AraC-like DNA-binding protein